MIPSKINNQTTPAGQSTTPTTPLPRSEGKFRAPPDRTVCAVGADGHSVARTPHGDSIKVHLLLHRDRTAPTITDHTTALHWCGTEEAAEEQRASCRHGEVVPLPPPVPGRPGLGRRRVGGRLLRPVRRGRLRQQRARERRRHGPAGGAHARPRQRRLRLQLQGQVPLRRVQRPDEAHRRQLRRHRHLLLPDVRGGRRPRRDRHRVHGQPQRRPLRDEHQRLGQRRRQEGAPVLPLVRPHRRLPHLQDRLEPQEHHIPGGRRAGEDLQEVRRPAVPEQPAHDGARHALGRQLLGHPSRRRQDRLDPGALRRQLPGLLLQRLCQQRRLVGVPRRQRRLDEPGARRQGPRHRRLGREQVHVLRLLHRRLALPQRLPRRVQPQLIHPLHHGSSINFLLVVAVPVCPFDSRRTHRCSTFWRISHVHFQPWI